MNKDLEMRILPSFCDKECSIIFSFYFNTEKQKIGEAVICTWSEGYHQEDLDSGAEKNFSLGKKIALIKEFEVIEEYKKRSFQKMIEFLKVIGIQNYVYKKQVQEFSLNH
ncbi:hypothetical protein J7I93_03175 [Bacillus sp. ISL-47]|uniref:hypothetical protein n=1 Tax=Bacillus sp. ISL-47 TaxID=2819130 RepID=UPI001BE6A765|nr:hypothetical protein [Bacillus sp. ISL-47]MBT2687180.1 hypothetical protein [Bacillus sp. ISL-47]MBT2709780.1 hypothetical protein [Pseudomonas sp. ISL-84]